VTVVSSFNTENDVRMEVGQSAEVGGYRFELQDMALVQGPNYTSAQGQMRVTQDGELVAVLRPERRIYTVSRMPLTEVAIDRSVMRDLYVALGEPVSDVAWSVRLHHKPLVNWIWGGCLMMAVGGFLAMADRRYRAVRTRQRDAEQTMAPGLSPLVAQKAQP
jgi:cytochrome c-type biogenesis protein CcmF